MYTRIAALIVFALALTAGGWKCYQIGKSHVQVMWDADIAERTAAALQAEQKARAKEQILNAAVADARSRYVKQVSATNTIVAATAGGLRELERQLNLASVSSAAPGNPPGIDGADPRPTIAGECARQLGTLDEAYRKLANQARALQEIAPLVRVK